ncbi:MAG: hypothetical protein ACHQ9S_18865 [Candidatus Binatia bacterium]
MSLTTARFNQSPSEVKRYLVDFTLDLATGESLVSIPAPTITSPSGELIPTLVVSSIALAPAVGGQITMFTFFVSGGTAGQNYEIDFLASTTLTQVLECVVAFNTAVKT